MKRQISNEVAIVIFAVALTLLLYFGYSIWVKDPPKVSPEETLRMMTEHNKKQNAGHQAPATAPPAARPR